MTLEQAERLADLLIKQAVLKERGEKAYLNGQSKLRIVYEDAEALIIEELDKIRLA